MTAARVYPGSTITLQTVFTVGGTPANAPAIVFKWNIGTNGIKTITPTNTGTGTYTATITLPTDQSGMLRYRWDTEESVDFAEEGVILVEPTSFNEFTNDYS